VLYLHRPRAAWATSAVTRGARRHRFHPFRRERGVPGRSADLARRRPPRDVGIFSGEVAFDLSPVPGRSPLAGPFQTLTASAAGGRECEELETWAKQAVPRSSASSIVVQPRHNRVIIAGVLPARPHSGHHCSGDTPA
jgi:hypothetical protein